MRYERSRNAWTAFGDGAPALTTDGALWWDLIESAADATARQVLAFLEAAHALIPWTEHRVWEPLFDPLAHVDGLVDAWRTTSEPLRSSLAWGLARARHLRADSLPDGMRARIAAECVDSEDWASHASDLDRGEAVWPGGSFRHALLEAALASERPIASNVVAHLLETHAADEGHNVLETTPAERIALWLRASVDESLDALRPPLPGLTAEEREALASLVGTWTSGTASPGDPISRFLACEALLRDGELDVACDPWLSDEMFTWAGDLAAPGCGLCSAVGEASDMELPLRVVRLLTRLPRARREALLTQAERSGEIPDATRLRAWLDQDPHSYFAAVRTRGLTHDDLPAPMRDAIGLAWSRLAIAPDGDLPRLLQRAVLATWGTIASILGPDSSALACAARPELAQLLAERGGFLVIDPEQRMGDEPGAAALARIRRLVELDVPIPVLFGAARHLRHAQAQPPPGWQAVRHIPTDPDRYRSWVREIELTLRVAQRLGSSEPGVAVMMTSLKRALDGHIDGSEAAVAAAEAIEAGWEAAPRDPAMAASHYVACALDQALQLGLRADQDGVDDIALRAFVLARAAQLGVSPDDPLVCAERRAWWTWWLLEAAPEAFRTNGSRKCEA